MFGRFVFGLAICVAVVGAFPTAKPAPHKNSMKVMMRNKSKGKHPRVDVMQDLTMTKVDVPFELDLRSEFKDTQGLDIVSYDAVGLPDGLALVDGVISGTPTEIGRYSLQLSATNEIGDVGEISEFHFIVTSGSGIIPTSTPSVSPDAPSPSASQVCAHTCLAPSIGPCQNQENNVCYPRLQGDSGSFCDISLLDCGGDDGGNLLVSKAVETMWLKLQSLEDTPIF